VVLWENVAEESWRRFLHLLPRAGAAAVTAAQEGTGAAQRGSHGGSRAGQQQERRSEEVPIRFGHSVRQQETRE